MDNVPVDVMTTVRRATPAVGDPTRMLPAAAYTSPEVLAWELRHLFAGSWTRLGRLVGLFPGAGRDPARGRGRRRVCPAGA